MGIPSGLAVWGLLTVAGLAALLAASASAYAVVKLAGAAYLVWLGARTLWLSRRARDAALPELPRQRLDHPYRTGLLSNVLNPKIAVFYTSLLPQLVPAGAPHTLGLVALVLAHVLLSVAWLLAYSAAVHGVAAGLRRPSVRQALERVTGVALVGLGVAVALDRRD